MPVGRVAPVGMIVELVHDDGSMMRLADGMALAGRTGLTVITIADLVAWRRSRDRVSARAHSVLPTEHGVFAVTAYADLVTGADHLALVSPAGMGSDEEALEDSDHQAAVLVRVHSECLTGDVFGSRRCDCGPQLQASMQAVARDGGVVIYLRGHEGRGVGLIDKLRAYALQDNGFDTVDAQTELGLPVDAREYDAAAAILQDLGVQRVRLLTNNPRKAAALAELGIEVVASVPLHVGRTPENERYLRTKRERLGHTPPTTSTEGVLT